ncbi:copper chaperone PCu(A)C [Limimaricola sp. AA108-03]|uniref:copper chaperone PCu(A)C n=1 Tax=Limimaricola sp. AA108-03 TaxID=3425945 RepID=UPI003D77D9EF
MTLRPLAFLATIGLAGAAQAHDYGSGDLTVLHPFAIETAERATTGAGYFAIRNDGDAADALIAVEADFPKVALHEAVETDGMMTMQPLERIEIAPGETVTLAPGRGGHVMFMGLENPFEVDGRFAATLVFETAGPVEVEFVVEPRPEAGTPREGMDHGDMDHEAMGHGAMNEGEMDHGDMDHGAMIEGDDAPAAAQ